MSILPAGTVSRKHQVETKLRVDILILYGHTLLIHTVYSKMQDARLIVDQPGKVANPARGQLNREN